MTEGLLSIGALLLLGAVAFWYLRIAEDPTQIDQEEAHSIEGDIAESPHKSSNPPESELEQEYK